MPNPYLVAALRAQDDKRPTKSSASDVPVEKKAALKSADNNNPPSKES